KATKPRAALVRRRLVAVSPGRDVGDTVSQLRPARKIHVDTGAANHEVGGEYAPRRLQFDTTRRFVGAFDRRALLQPKIGVAGTAVVGCLRKTFPHLQNAAQEAPP